MDKRCGLTGLCFRVYDHAKGEGYSVCGMQRVYPEDLPEQEPVAKADRPEMAPSALLVISNGGARRYEIGREGQEGLLYPRQLGDLIERFALLPLLAPPELPTLEKAVRENILCWLSESVDADKTRDERQYAKNSAAALQSLLKEAGLPPVIYVAPAEDP